ESKKSRDRCHRKTSGDTAGTRSEGLVSASCRVSVYRSAATRGGRGTVAHNHCCPRRINLQKYAPAWLGRGGASTRTSKFLAGSLDRIQKAKDPSGGTCSCRCREGPGTSCSFCAGRNQLGSPRSIRCFEWSG